MFLQLRIALQVVSSLRLPLSRNIQEEAECVVLAVRGKRANTQSFPSLFMAARLWKINNSENRSQTQCALVAI